MSYQNELPALSYYAPHKYWSRRIAVMVSLKGIRKQYELWVNYIGHYPQATLALGFICNLLSIDPVEVVIRASPAPIIKEMSRKEFSSNLKLIGYEKIM
jgi:hypothetical protein